MAGPRRFRKHLLPLTLVAFSSCTYQPVDFTFLNLEPESIDPGLSSGVADSRVIRGLFCGLTSSHPQTLADLPELATNWETSTDGLTWTFHLRESAWSDGTPLTAADFVWSYARILDPRSESKSLDQFFIFRNAEAYYRGELTDFAAVGVRAPDPRTLVLELTSPVPYLTQLTSFEPFFPVPRHAIAKWGSSFWTKPGKIVSNGPFVLDEWRFRERIVLRKNPLYWDRDNVKVERVAAVAVETENAGFTMYETGLADWAERSSIPLAHILDDLRGRPDLHFTPYLGTYFVAVNTTYPPFDNPRVRLAFSLAIDRHSIVDNVTRAAEEPAFSFIYPGMPGYTPPDTRLAEDRDRARQILAAEGYPGGQGLPYLEYLYNTNEQHKAIGEILQRQWQDVLGVHVELRNVEWQVYLETERQLGHKPFSRSGWIGDYQDASTFLRILTKDAGNNYSGYNDPVYEDLVKRALAEPDPIARLALYQQAETKIITDLPVIPLFFYTQVRLVKPWVSGDPGNLQSKLMLKWIRVDHEAKRRWLERGPIRPGMTPLDPVVTPP